MDSFSNKQSRFPSLARWRQLPRVLSPRERIILPGLVVIFLVSLFSLANGLYIANTVVVPAKGGHMTEGVLGSPRFVNPVYADTNDVDRDLIQLIYSGLVRYSATGGLVPDLAAAPPEITEGGKVVTVSLRQDVLWHDGTPFGADDILFTVATIQDPAYKSPIRANWIGVDVEKVSDYKVRFHLLDPYAPFAERLTLKILPVHLWGEVAPENFALTPLNLQPIGTGPYRVTKVAQERSGTVSEMQLKAYDDYHLEGPFIASFTFRFFSSEEDIMREANRGTLQNFSLASSDNIERMKNPAFEQYSFRIPRYFALFFNLNPPNAQSQVTELPVRQALQLLVDKQEIGARVFKNTASVVHSPFLPGVFGFAEPPLIPQTNQQEALALLEQEGYIKERGMIGKPRLSGEALASDLQQGDNGQAVTRLQQCLANPPAGGPDVYPEAIVNGNFGPLTRQAVVRFQEKYADEVLAPIGLTQGTGKAGPLTREKLNGLCFSGDGEAVPLMIRVTTIDQSPLVEVAQELKRQWEAAGLQVEVETFPAQELERDIVKPRAYETLLFGEVLGTIPDPFPFWHSSQAASPGLNLSAYENKSVDTLLEAARKELDAARRAELFAQAQDLLLADVPALFLYDMNYRYFVSKEVQGLQTPVLADPSQRFSGVAEWFAETKRARP